MAAPATIARPTGETLRGKQKEKDVRMSNIIAAKGNPPKSINSLSILLIDTH